MPPWRIDAPMSQPVSTAPGVLCGILQPSRAAGDEQIAELLEVDNLQRGHHVLQCDHAVHKVEPRLGHWGQKVGAGGDKLHRARLLALGPLLRCGV